MKKLYNIVILVLLVTLIAGCSKNNNEKYTCTLISEDQSLTNTIEFNVKNEYVINSKVIMKFKTEQDTIDMCNVLSLSSDAKDNLKCNKKDIIINDYHLSLGKDKVKKDVLIEHLESLKYSCTK